MWVQTCKLQKYSNFGSHYICNGGFREARGAVDPPSLQPQGIQKTPCIDIKMH